MGARGGDREEPGAWAYDARRMDGVNEARRRKKEERSKEYEGSGYSRKIRILMTRNVCFVSGSLVWNRLQKAMRTRLLV